METNSKNQPESSELISRYVYAVTKHIPAKQRDDIDKEIRTMIDDMLTDRFPGKEQEIESVRDVLTGLGNPYDLAQKFQDTKRYLIGPDYFDIYLFILKIVLAAVSGGLLIALTIKNVVAPPADPFVMAGEILSTIFSALFGVFAWVTIIFALISYYADPSLKSEIMKIKEQNKWSLSDLPEIPGKKAIIKKSEPITGIIFQILALILFNYAPQIFGIISSKGDTTTIIPILNLEKLSSFIILINIIIFIGLIKETARLLEGRYTLRLSIGISFLGCLSLILTVLLITNQQFWNPDFAIDFAKAFGTEFPPFFNIADASSSILKIFIGLAVFGYIVETITNFYRAIKYGVATRKLR
ncbi:MAG: HAAS signaling domain-containing protein [Saccharofermentanales bacterium]